MGLDMYLTKKTYVKNWDHEGPDARHTVTVTGPSASHIRPERISSIEEEVAYWRKANAIHQWFVDHCQNGIDECQQTYVTREQLTELAFLNDRSRSLGEFAPPDTFVLHLYGRYCNGDRFAGETDFWEAFDEVKRRYPIDEDRLVVRGFSLGGAACWHMATTVCSITPAARPRQPAWAAATTCPR